MSSDGAAADGYFEIMSRYSLVQSLTQDLEFLRRVHHTTLKEHITKIWGWDESQQDSYVAEDFESGQIQVIHFNGQKIGYLHLTQDKDILFIANILILPEFQSLGIGCSISRFHEKDEPIHLRPSAAFLKIKICSQNQFITIPVWSTLTCLIEAIT